MAAAARTRRLALTLAVLAMAGCGTALAPRSRTLVSPSPSPTCADAVRGALLAAPVAYPPGPLAPVVRRAGVPTTLFLIAEAARKSYPYFRTLQTLGARIEDHTISHPECTRLTYAEQVRQICTTASTYRTVFGRRPTLFRPPYGDFGNATRRAAAACGMHALVNWDVTVSAGRIAYAVGNHLRPGDILLLHFTSTLRRDFRIALAAAKAGGFTIARLENYL